MFVSVLVALAWAGVALCVNPYLAQEEVRVTYYRIIFSEVPHPEALPVHLGYVTSFVVHKIKPAAGTNPSLLVYHNILLYTGH